MFRTFKVLCLVFGLVLVGSVVAREELYAVCSVLISWTVVGSTYRSKLLVSKRTGPVIMEVCGFLPTQHAGAQKNRRTNFNDTTRTNHKGPTQH